MRRGRKKRKKRRKEGRRAREREERGKRRREGKERGRRGERERKERNKEKFHFIIKENYILDKSKSLNDHKMLLNYEKSRISFKTQKLSI